MGYWDHTGAHQALYDSIREKLVPRSGPAPTPHGELLRVATRVYYAFHNDGDDTAAALVGMRRIEERDLRAAPADAPTAIKDLFAKLRAGRRIRAGELELAVDAAVTYAASKLDP